MADEILQWQYFLTEKLMKSILIKKNLIEDHKPS